MCYPVNKGRRRVDPFLLFLLLCWSLVQSSVSWVCFVLQGSTQIWVRAGIPFLCGWEYIFQCSGFFVARLFDFFLIAGDSQSFTILHTLRRLNSTLHKVQLSYPCVGYKHVIVLCVVCVSVCVTVCCRRVLWSPDVIVKQAVIDFCAPDGSGNNMDSWVCPNDRQLALRAKYVAITFVVRVDTCLVTVCWRN